MSYKPRQSDGSNIMELIDKLGSNPPAERQVPVITNIIRALYNLDRVFDDIGGPPILYFVSSDYTATDNDLIVIRNLTSDITITLPESGSIYIKRMDDSNYTVTINGTIDGETGVILDYRDGMHLVGSSNQFFFV
jgi:hypothetical protein